MLGLPESTEFNRTIPKKTLFTKAILTDSMRSIYESQVTRIIWRNKLSNATYPLYSDAATGSELELFEIQTKGKKLDKRLLRSIDRSIPYYIFHVVNYGDMRQAWIAKKRSSRRSMRIENYYHTTWMPETEFQFEFTGNTPKATLNNLIDQLDAQRSRLPSEQLEQCNAFMAYFRDMKMSRSYKPVLVMATIQNGGSITLEKAAIQFTRFYQGRAERGLPTENGYCVYCDKEAPLSKVCTNLVTMPITALCNSGYFTYDKLTRVFSFADDLYDNLTLEEIDEIVSICKMRLDRYFDRITER